MGIWFELEEEWRVSVNMFDGVILLGILNYVFSIVRVVL